MDRLARELVALAVFLPVAQDAHAGVRNAQDLVRVDGAHVSELDELAGLAFRVGAAVQKDRPPGHRGGHGQDRRPVHPGQAPEHEHADGHHGAGVPGAHQRVPLAGLEPVEGDPHGRVLLLQGTAGRVVHVDGRGGGDDAYGRRIVRVTGQLRLDRVRLAHQDDGHPVFLGGLQGTRYDNARAVVTAHRVNDNPPHHGPGATG